MVANPKNIPQHYYSLDEYLALEQASHTRFEYWDGEIVCMSGGSLKHGQISSNVHFRLRSQLGGKGCQVFTADTSVKTPTLPPYRYPDVSVVCGEVKVERIRSVEALTNPVLIVEVLSPTTAERDRAEKFDAYRVLPSFREYLLIEQDRPFVIRHYRGADDEWRSEEIVGLDADITLQSVSSALKMAEIYEEVGFDAP